MEKISFKRIGAIMLMFLLVAGITTFMSCEKEDLMTTTSNQTTTIQNKRLKLTLTKQEKINYFNALGKKHNEVLEYVGRTINVVRSSQEERFSVAANYLNDKKNTWAKTKEAIEQAEKIINDPLNASQYLPEKMNDKIKAYYDSLALILNRCMNVADESEIITPDEYDQMVNKLEDEIYSNYDVVINTETQIGNDAAMFLTSSAISRYSYRFWFNAISDSTNSWYAFFEKDVTRKNIFGKIWHAIKVAAVDTYTTLTSGWDCQTYGDGFIEPYTTVCTWDVDAALDAGSDASSSVK